MSTHFSQVGACAAFSWLTMPVFFFKAVKGSVKTAKSTGYMGVENSKILYLPRARLAKCPQTSIFAMPVAFTGKYREILANNGKYWQI